MSLIRLEKVKCVCGVEKEIQVCDSINIQVDPNLKKKVLKREINSFKCDKCGYQQELVGQFLYHDMSNNLMIWVYPCFMKDKLDNLEKAPKKLNKIKDALDIKQVSVFGYDELFKLLNEKW